MRAFLKGVEKRDERFILQALLTIEFESGERVIRAGTYDKSVLFVAGGELIAFGAGETVDGEPENVVYGEGSILGVEQFLFNKEWPHDIICKSQATVCKLRHEGMLNLISQNAIAASRLQRRIMRHYCFMQIYEKKKANIGLFKFSEIEDEDLFIDLKLDVMGNEPDAALFNLMSQSRPEERRNRKECKKGAQLETMPYFLTAAYKEIIDGVHKEREEERKRVEEAQEAGGKKSKNKESEGAQTSSGGMYRSMFLKTKVEQ